jgi:hypothetical protein
MTRLGNGFSGASIKTVSKSFQILHGDAEPSAPIRVRPVQTESAKFGKSRKWSIAFGIVCAPFLVLGFPIHLLFRYGKGTSAPERVPVPNRKRKSEWFQGILFPGNVLLLLCTMVMLTISAILTIYFLRSVWNIFDYLVLRGELVFKLVVNFAIFFRTLPAIVPLFVIWIIGYSHRDVIASFDTYRNRFVKRLKLRPRAKPKADFEHPVTKPGFWIKLSAIYFAIICIHVIPLVADGWRGQHWTSIWIGFMYRFIPPVYCMCCWVLESEFQILSGFLTALLKDETTLTPEIIEEIKELYKKVTNHVTYVNKKIGKYLSFWIFPVLVFSTASHLVIMIFYLFGNISLRTLLLFYGIVGEVDEEVMMEKAASALVRSAVAHIFVGLLEVGLIGFMIRQAIAVSDESRFAHVLINEVIGDHSLPVIKNEDVYHASRHLKFYMYMTHEYDNPALMMLPTIARLPFIGYRLHSSKLRNPPLHRRFLNEIV